MNTDGIIFDMDGTLWDSSEGVAHSWNIVLEKENYTKKIITTADIQSVMGLTLDAVAEKFFPQEDKTFREQLVSKCAEYENEYLAINGGILYDKLEETLIYLKNRYPLFIVSNCQRGYIECFFEHYGFEKYFSDYTCWGNNLLKKGDNIKLIIDRNSLHEPVYVGDTQGDCDSTYYAGAKFIHASYGFGTADRCNASIKHFSELSDIFM